MSFERALFRYASALNLQQLFMHDFHRILQVRRQKKTKIVALLNFADWLLLVKGGPLRARRGAGRSAGGARPAQKRFAGFLSELSRAGRTLNTLESALNTCQRHREHLLKHPEHLLRYTSHPLTLQETRSTVPQKPGGRSAAKACAVTAPRRPSDRQLSPVPPRHATLSCW